MPCGHVIDGRCYERYANGITPARARDMAREEVEKARRDEAVVLKEDGEEDSKASIIPLGVDADSSMEGSSSSSSSGSHSRLRVKRPREDDDGEGFERDEPHKALKPDEGSSATHGVRNSPSDKGKGRAISSDGDVSAGGDTATHATLTDAPSHQRGANRIKIDAEEEHAAAAPVDSETEDEQSVSHSTVGANRGRGRARGGSRSRPGGRTAGGAASLATSPGGASKTKKASVAGATTTAAATEKPCKRVKTFVCPVEGCNQRVATQQGRAASGVELYV